MKIIPLITLLSLALLCACQPEDKSPLARYRSAVSQGLEASPTDMSTVMGINLGMTDAEYYDRCTELNRQQLITMGGGGNVTDHRLTHELDRPATLSFSPVFTGSNPRRIQGMNLTFKYDDWSPWNKEAYSDKLLVDAADYMADLLGVELLEFDHPRHGHIYTDVTGSRHFVLWKVDDAEVRGSFSDLTSLGNDPLGLLQ